MRSKNFLYAALIAIILVLLGYVFLNSKKGKGYDTITRYSQEQDWPHLPKNLFLGNPTGISIDTNQNVIVFHRSDRKWPLTGAMPDSPITNKTVLIIDKNKGELLDSWGDHLFIMPHGLKVDHQNNIWLTDVGLHQVFKFSHDGKLLLTLGEAKTPGNDGLHFDKPTDIAISENGSFYVSDGYGNSRIIKFSPEGKYLFAWGKKGDKEGEFNLPHGISLDNDGNVYVADRENSRIQIFDSSGKFIKKYAGNSFGTIYAVAFDQSTSKLFAVDDFSILNSRHRGSDVFIFDNSGKVQSRFGRSGFYHGNTSWYHALAVDKDENIYIGDILGNTIQKFRKDAAP